MVYANPSGSVGYGEDLARRLHGDWGRADSRELLALLDRLAADGIADPERVGAMGASYGGFLVNRLAGHHPDRFRALVSENPVTDHVAEWGGADLPFEITEAAISEARIPERVESLVAAFAVLHRSGATVEMIRYPDEPHGLKTNGRPDRRADRIDRIVAWFLRHL